MNSSLLCHIYCGPFREEELTTLEGTQLLKDKVVNEKI